MYQTTKNCIANPLRILLGLKRRGYLRWFPNSLYLRLVFRQNLGYPLDLKNPKTFNEKIQWLKLHGGLDRYSHLVDKYEVRKYVLSQIGEEYLIPLIGVWDKFEDIDFGKLPEQFVLKCTHDSGSVEICADEKTWDLKQAERTLKKNLKRNIARLRLEPQYENIKPRILCEQYMVDESGTDATSATTGLRDYKIYCFHGKPKIIQVIFDRFTEIKCNLYDTGWNYIPASKSYPTDPDTVINKPNKLEEMLHLAKILSADHPFVRVDLYSVSTTGATGGRIYFGELTFSPNSGFGKFDPVEFDRQMGDWLELPMEKS